MADFTYITEPYKHQAEALELYKDRDSLALFWEMGTGKTKATIDLMRYKSYGLGHPCRALVVAPNIALQNWVNEIEMHSKLKGIVLQGTKAKRLRNLANEDFSIKVINYEGLKTIQKELSATPFDCLVIDESQRVKNSKAIRTRILTHMSKKIDIRYLLSGTPVLNNSLDIFSQYLILDRGEIFGSSFYAFRNKYFEDKNAGRAGTRYYFPNFAPKPDTTKLLNKLIMQKADRRKKEECLDLPPKVYQTLQIPMEPEQQKAYNEMKKELITFFQEHPVTASTAVVKLVRLNQIASGYVGSENAGEIAFKRNPKIEALKEILADIAQDHKVIIWAIFRNNIKALEKALQEYNPSVIYGDTKDKVAEQDKFRKDPTCRICIANPQSAGLAINLVEADYTIYFSHSFNLEHRLQSEDRNHRGGSEIHEKITYIDLVSAGSVDEVILKALKSKENLAKTIIERLPEIL